MKTAKLLLLITLFIGGLLPLRADTPGKEGNTTDEPIRLKRDNSDGFPRMPARDYIECVYAGDGFILTPMYCEDVTTFTITVTNEFEWYEGETDEANGYYFFTGPLKGSYTISCMTHNGRTYVGSIVIP